MTLIRQLPFSNPGSAGLAPFPLPTALEREIFAHANVKRWFRADIGVNSSGWRCCKTGAMLVKARSSMPDVVTLSAYNGRPALKFSNGLNEQLWDGGAGLLPATTALSLVMVGRAGDNDNAFIVGGSDALGNSTMLLHNSTVASSGAVGFTFNATSPATNAGGTQSVAAGIYNATGPNLLIGSYDSSAVSKVAIRANRGAVNSAGNPTINAAANKAVNLQVGGINNASGGCVGPLEGGDVAEIIVLDSALHVDTTLRGKIETMLHDRYGLW